MKEQNIHLEQPIEIDDQKNDDEVAEEQADQVLVTKKDTTTIPQNIIDEARSIYGTDCIKVLALPLDDYDKEFFDVLVRVPSRKALGEYEKYSERQPLKAKEILINFCVLTGKQEILADDGLFNSCVNGLAELIPNRRAIIKNL